MELNVVMRTKEGEKAAASPVIYTSKCFEPWRLGGTLVVSAVGLLQWLSPLLLKRFRVLDAIRRPNTVIEAICNH